MAWADGVELSGAAQGHEVFMRCLQPMVHELLPDGLVAE